MLKCMIELSDGEYEAIRVGTHSIYISNENGSPQINLRDHMDMHVDGEHKGDVHIAYTSGEFGASFEQIGEREFWERYQK